jgi:hypothetical protein
MCLWENLSSVLCIKKRSLARELEAFLNILLEVSGTYVVTVYGMVVFAHTCDAGVFFINGMNICT